MEDKAGELAKESDIGPVSSHMGLLPSDQISAITSTVAMVSLGVGQLMICVDWPGQILSHGKSTVDVLHSVRSQASGPEIKSKFRILSFGLFLTCRGEKYE